MRASRRIMLDEAIVGLSVLGVDGEVGEGRCVEMAILAYSIVYPHCSFGQIASVALVTSY